MRPVAVPVVTAEDDTGPAGLLALSVSHVSHQPPTMSVAVGKSTSALAAIFRSGCFAINYLPEDNAELADIFGGKRDVDGAARFENANWGRLKTGAPVLSNAALVLDCAVDSVFECHETMIVIGVIQAHSIDPAKPILMSYKGSYRTLPG